MKKTQKQDTRGQALIFKENRETILYYLTASVVGAIFYSVVHLCIFDSNTWVAWVSRFPRSLYYLFPDWLLDVDFARSFCNGSHG